MAICLIGAGANLGDRLVNLDAAKQTLSQTNGIRLLAASTWHETRPIGGPPDQPAFLNGALLIETARQPRSLLALLQEVEARFGRCRLGRWSARTLDLDLLLYDSLQVREPDLRVPHPRMAFRRFVLEPAVEIAAGMVDPTTGWTLARLAQRLRAGANYLAVSGPPVEFSGKLCRRLGQLLEGRLLNDPAAIVGSSGSSSPTLTEQVELASRRAELLAPEAFTNRVDWVVSNFWLADSLAHAKLTLEPVEFAAFQRRWQELNSKAVAPKIAVVCTTSDAVGEAECVCRSWGPSEATKFAATVQAVAHRYGVGPILTIETHDLDEAAAEVLAAAHASQ
jgi:2-amino-4-hydroxy-6-hydroxymethyldihydropteridine diphosphokinase